MEYKNFEYSINDLNDENKIKLNLRVKQESFGTEDNPTKNNNTSRYLKKCKSLYDTNPRNKYF